MCRCTVAGLAGVAQAPRSRATLSTIPSPILNYQLVARVDHGREAASTRYEATDPRLGRVNFRPGRVNCSPARRIYRERSTSVLGAASALAATGRETDLGGVESLGMK